MTDSIARRAIITPPQCVKELIVNANSELITEIDNRQEHYAYLGIECKCGSKDFQVSGHIYRDESSPRNSMLISPLSLYCPSCEKTFVIIDIRRHGLDGESGVYKDLEIEGDRCKYICEKCKDNVFGIVAAFEYALEEEDIKNDPQLSERVQDFFTWFVLYAKCAKCGYFARISDIECA